MTPFDFLFVCFYNKTDARERNDLKRRYNNKKGFLNTRSIFCCFKERKHLKRLSAVYFLSLAADQREPPRKGDN